MGLREKYAYAKIFEANREQLSDPNLIMRGSPSLSARLQPHSIYLRRRPAVSQEEPSPSVLLVEDDRDGRRMYAEWLSLAGFRVEQAHNGLQALERALELRPDVIVTDLNIPGIDGFELTRRLRDDERTRAIPVVAVTGYSAFAADPARAHRAGCDVVLPKPYAPDELETAIRSLIDAVRQGGREA